jgi:hypothetical protein
MSNIQLLIDKLHRKLSSGECKKKGCMIHIARKGPSIQQTECILCCDEEEKGVANDNYEKTN